MSLRADVTKADQARATRLVLAWRTDDVENLNLVLAEADRQPGGVAALIFALAGFASGLVDAVPGGGTDTLRKGLLKLLDAPEPPATPAN